MRHIQRKATPNNPKIPFKLFGVALLCYYSRKIYAYEWRYAFLNSTPIALYLRVAQDLSWTKTHRLGDVIELANLIHCHATLSCDAR